MTAIQHYMNPLHVYCRLRDLGLTKNQALCVCRIYEESFFRRWVLVKKVLTWR